MKKNLFLLLVFFAMVSSNTSANDGQCTVGYAMGNAVENNRPLIWRNYDWNNAPHHSQVMNPDSNTSGYLRDWGPLNWIATSQESWYVFGGLNEKGVGCFNTLITDFNEEGGYDFGNYRIQAWIMGNATSVAHVRQAIDEQIKFWAGTTGGVDHDWKYGQYYPAMTLVVIDADGNASVFEIARDFWFEYDPQNAGRLAQYPTQVGARANKAHRRTDHKDNTGADPIADWATTGGRRYMEARDNLTAMATNGDGVTVEEVMNVVSRNGEPGLNLTNLVCFRWMKRPNTRTQTGKIRTGLLYGQPHQMKILW